MRVQILGCFRALASWSACRQGVSLNTIKQKTRKVTQIYRKIIFPLSLRTIRIENIFPIYVIHSTWWPLSKALFWWPTAQIRFSEIWETLSDRVIFVHQHFDQTGGSGPVSPGAKGQVYSLYLWAANGCRYQTGIQTQIPYRKDSSSQSNDVHIFNLIF